MSSGTPRAGPTFRPDSDPETEVGGGISRELHDGGEQGIPATNQQTSSYIITNSKNNSQDDTKDNIHVHVDNTIDEPPTEHSPSSRHNSSSSSSSSSSSTTTAQPFIFLGETSPTRFWLIFGQILSAQFLASFDSTIMASSHPVITSHFKAANSASWLSTAFLLTSTAFQPLLGRLSDAMGRKPLFLISLAIFALATLWCAVAGSIESFVAARAVCGLGAGGAMTLGSILTSDLVPIERRGNYQSYVNVSFGAGAAFGAALGGAMAEALGWRWEFGVQIPPILLCIAVAVVVIPDDIGLKGARKGVWEALSEFDFKGSILLTVSTTSAILGLNFGGNIYPWTHPFVIASLSIAAISFPTFLWIESRVHMPIMPLRLIRHSPRANLIFSNFIAALLSNSILFNIATSSGLRLALPSIVSSITGASTGFAITYTRRLKWPVVSGTLWYLAGCITLCFLHRGMSTIVYLLVLLPQSIGQGFQFPGTFMAILASSSQGGSVEAVAQLEEPYREQVVQSYEASLRLTFILCSVIAAVSVLIILPIKLPRLAPVNRKS
ncbi:hypothetical protein TrVGV298_001405 [Trichoderma virens]|nr:hypothetical protein TrVGV298_001405 [Trichoderma virens]